jgi:hypothetical protein
MKFLIKVSNKFHHQEHNCIIPKILSLNHWYILMAFPDMLATLTVVKCHQIKIRTYEIWGFHSSEDVDIGLLGSNMLTFT